MEFNTLSQNNLEEQIDEREPSIKIENSNIFIAESLEDIENFRDLLMGIEPKYQEPIEPAKEKGYEINQKEIGMIQKNIGPRIP